MKKKIVLFGAGGHAISCIDVIERENKYKIEFILDKYSSKKKIKNYRVIKESDENLKFLIKNKIYNVLITIGQIESSNIRVNLFKKLKKKGFKFPIIKSPFSIISKNSNINEGTIVLHNVVINSEAKIGKNCIINSSSLIEHGVIVGDNTHISTGAIINGDCSIGKNSFIGSGAIIRQGVKIKDYSFVKMGCLIKK